MLGAQQQHPLQLQHLQGYASANPNPGSQQSQGPLLLRAAPQHSQQSAQTQQGTEIRVCLRFLILLNMSIRYY